MKYSLARAGAEDRQEVRPRGATALAPRARKATAGTPFGWHFGRSAAPLRSLPPRYRFALPVARSHRPRSTTATHYVRVRSIMPPVLGALISRHDPDCFYRVRPAQRRRAPSWASACHLDPRQQYGLRAAQLLSAQAVFIWLSRDSGHGQLTLRRHLPRITAASLSGGEFGHVQ